MRDKHGWISTAYLPAESKTKPWLVYTDREVDAIEGYICRGWWIGIWVDAFGNYIVPSHYRPMPELPEVEDD